MNAATMSEEGKAIPNFKFEISDFDLQFIVLGVAAFILPCCLFTFFFAYEKDLSPLVELPSSPVEGDFRLDP